MTWGKFKVWLARIFGRRHVSIVCNFNLPPGTTACAARRSADQIAIDIARQLHRHDRRNN